MNRYALAFILALLVACPIFSALAAQSAMSEKDQAAIMANAIEGMKKQLKQLEAMYQSGEALRTLEQAEENIRALEAQVSNNPEALRAYEKKREEIRAAKAALRDPERLREIEELRKKIRELEATPADKPAEQAEKSAPEAAKKTETAERVDKSAEQAKDMDVTGTLGPYSADLVDVKSGRVTRKLAVTPDKVYAEDFDPQGKLFARAIVRLDQKKMYVVVEPLKSYVELTFDQKEDAAEVLLDRGPGKREKVGAETVNGYQADKCRITDPDDNTISYEWISAEFGPKPIRTERKGAIEEMRNIKLGQPDASLFEIPAGYKRDTKTEQMMKNLG